MTLLLAGKTSLILFLIGLLNQNRTSHSIYPHKFTNYNYQNNHNNQNNNNNPYNHGRLLKENLLASLITNPIVSDPLRYLSMKQMPFISSAQSLSSWMYQLPFATGNAQCDHSLMLEPEFHRCKSNAAVYWQQGLSSSPLSQQQQQTSSTTTSPSNKHTCCFLWDLVDCMEEAIRRRCNYSLDTFRRNRLDYIARIQSNPLCFNHLYGSWSCMQENWILILAFIILAIFITVTVLIVCWTLFCRKKFSPNNKQIDYNENVLPPVPVAHNHNHVNDFDIEQRHHHNTFTNQQQQQRMTKRQSSPRRVFHSNTNIKHIDSDVEDETTASPLTFKDYQPPRRFQQSIPNKHHYSVSSKYRTSRSPPPPSSTSIRYE